MVLNNILIFSQSSGSAPSGAGGEHPAAEHQEDHDGLHWGLGDRSQEADQRGAGDHGQPPGDRAQDDRGRHHQEDE